MSEKVQEFLEKKIMSCTDSKDAFNYAKAYSETVKADAERDRIDWAANDQVARTELEQIKVSNEAAFNSKRLENDRLKIEAEERIQKKRIESEERHQRYRADKASKDNLIKTAAFLGGIGVMFGAEVKGILVSRQAGSLARLIKF